MPRIACPIENCAYVTDDVEAVIAASLIQVHGSTHTAPAPAGAAAALATRPKGPKLERPSINMGVELETWNSFVRRWRAFKDGSGINDNGATYQLIHCADELLSDTILKADPGITERDADHVLRTMKAFAVIPVAVGVLRAELVEMKQSPDELFRSFAARVRGKAETCQFNMKAKCDCNRDLVVDYTEPMIRDVLLAGISDPDIRREALGTDAIQLYTLNDLVALIETKEIARNSISPGSSSISAVSTYRRAMTAPPKNEARTTPTLPRTAGPRPSHTPTTAERAQSSPCPDCGRNFMLFTEGPRGWNRNAFSRCVDCHRARRTWRGGGRGNTGGRGGTGGSNAVEAAADATSEVTQICGSISAESKANQQQQQKQQKQQQKQQKQQQKLYLTPEAQDKNHQIVLLEHHIFTRGAWRKARFAKHPRIKIKVSLDKDKHRQGRKIGATIDAIADSGAQSNLWGLQKYIDSGFRKEDLLEVKTSLSAANKSSIRICGAFFSNICGSTSEGEEIMTKCLIYVSPDVSDLFVSQETMIQLEIIGQDFPRVGGARAAATTQPTSTTTPTRPSINVIRSMNGGCTSTESEKSCDCPMRTTVPDRPKSLPFRCCPENNVKMKMWLLEQFGASTFNTCPHRPLPVMSGPPVEIHLQDDAVPRACHTAATVPIHWQDDVYKGLLRDEALGVIEKVPYGEPVTWCHRMVVTRKHDGTPRRTVDLSPLNKFCKRETFATESPFHVARRVPGNTWKSITDAWNGYHSCALRESDRHLTTFISPFGRWRYCRAPQGFLSSGDGYNRRFDAILADIERKERVVDDTLHYDEDLEAHWWRTIDILRTMGHGGIVLNPDKFQFAQREVEFAGFHVKDDSVEPVPKIFDAIRKFPSLKSTTDVRAWWGLVNQVGHYAQLREIMAPFKPFLSPKHKFYWNDNLEEAFQDSKERIVDLIREGVKIFDVKRQTCLRPDWSKEGIGYFLSQKHCQCPSQLPDCCQDGWKITMAGSRFLASAESRYAPIEGEALAVAWALEQTRFFTQGCDNLVVVTDHKPLVKILGDRTLDEIRNTRLFRLKQRTLPWFFRIAHLPGKTNLAADAASRYPATTEVEPEGNDEIEPAICAAIRRETEDVAALTWQRIATATENDPAMRALRQAVEVGQIDSSLNSDPTIGPLWQYRSGLYVAEGVLLYEDRVVVPPALRQQVLANLHAAHQGTSSMETSARAVVFWPGMTVDIDRTRANCIECLRTAPSQPPLPSTPATPPTTPFEAIYADYFDFAGHHYLVVGDRLSGWVELYSTPIGSSTSGAAGLVMCLRAFFSTFGVPMELSSDGGPEFTAGQTMDFLKRWGVRQRVSSAYFPQSNGRAEVAVKSAKRLLRSNVGPSGSLNSDSFMRAILQLRNTPDPDCLMSPAQIVFGRQLRSALAFSGRLDKYSNPSVRPEWRQAWKLKEDALKARFVRTSSMLNQHSRSLSPLVIGQKCLVQNQAGNCPRRWDRSGIVMEVLEHDQYRMKVDGSNRLTLRNRKFLRPYHSAVSEADDEEVPREAGRASAEGAASPFLRGPEEEEAAPSGPPQQVATGAGLEPPQRPTSPPVAPLPQPTLAPPSALPAALAPTVDDAPRRRRNAPPPKRYGDWVFS